MRKACMVISLLGGRARDGFASLFDVLANAVHGVATGQGESSEERQQGDQAGHGTGLRLCEVVRVQAMRRTSTKWPCMAAAAAMAGLTKWVRPPAPWRPSKLRLLVEAQRSPGSRRSAFMARHMEQPGSRHSKPAALKT